MKTIIEIPTRLPIEHIAALIEESGINVTEIVHDGATNLDAFGAAHGIPVKEFKPNREKYGSVAQEVNHRAMIEYSEALIADGENKYNAAMIEQARSAGRVVFILPR